MAGYLTTPLSTDLYSRVMVDGFSEQDQIMVSSTGQSFFGRTETGANTVFSPDALDVDIDVQRATRTTAALVPRNMVSKTLGSLQQKTQVDRFTNFQRTYPLIEEQGALSAAQLLNRSFDENPYSNDTRQTRLIRLAKKQHKEQIRRILRLQEVLAWQMLLTGKQDAILGTSDTDLQYDLKRNTNLTTTVSTAWTNAAADAVGDIDDMADLINQYGKVWADGILLGEDAMEGFVKNTAVQSYADNRRYTLSWVGDMPMTSVPSRFQFLIDGGATAMARLITPKGREFWIFTYKDTYTNSSGTNTKYLEAGTGLFFWSGARCDRYFGPPEMLPNIPMRTEMYSQLFGIDISSPPQVPNIQNSTRIYMPGMFYCDAYADASWKQVMIRTQTAPIFATNHVDAFGSYTNLA